MPRLFDLPRNVRVRLTSTLITWVDKNREETIGENVTWEGVTTNRYRHFRGVRRRLLINPTVSSHGELGIWQRDCDCELVEKS